MSKHAPEQLKAALDRARTRLAMLKETAGAKPDSETRRRLKEAETEEQTILAKLAETGVEA